MSVAMPEQPIRQAIEAGLWDYEAEFNPPGVTVVDRPDRLLWRTPSSSIYANKVVRATFSEENAEAGISEVMGFFAAEEKPFSWWVGPSSGPDSLERRLLDRGLRQTDMYEGVALLRNHAMPMRRHPDVTVAAVETEPEVRALVQVNAQVWGYSDKDQEGMARERLDYLALAARRGGYLLAYLGGKAVGTASYRYSSTGEVLYLTGAATLPDYRGRGVFTEMVRWRLADAAAKGCRMATCLAREGTSAPILGRLGFEKYLTLPVYAWEEKA